MTEFGINAVEQIPEVGLERLQVGVAGDQTTGEVVFTKRMGRDEFFSFRVPCDVFHDGLQCAG